MNNRTNASNEHTWACARLLVQVKPDYRHIVCFNKWNYEICPIFSSSPVWKSCICFVFASSWTYFTCIYTCKNTHTSIKTPFRWFYTYPLFVCLFICLAHTYTHTNGAHVDPYANLIRKLIMCIFLEWIRNSCRNFRLFRLCVLAWVDKTFDAFIRITVAFQHHCTVYIV